MMGLRPIPPAFGRARSAREHLTSVTRQNGTTFNLFGALVTNEDQQKAVEPPDRAVGDDRDGAAVFVGVGIRRLHRLAMLGEGLLA